MKRITSIIVAVLLLTACESAFTTDSVVGNWILKHQEDRNGKKKDCPRKMELGENKRATINESNGDKKVMEYFVSNDNNQKQLVLFPDLKEERGNFYYMQEDFIKLEFWERGVVCEYDKVK